LVILYNSISIEYVLKYTWLLPQGHLCRAEAYSVVSLSS
jgi:hypothetical protein